MCPGKSDPRHNLFGYEPIAGPACGSWSSCGWSAEAAFWAGVGNYGVVSTQYIVEGPYALLIPKVGIPNPGGCPYSGYYTAGNYFGAALPALATAGAGLLATAADEGPVTFASFLRNLSYSGLTRGAGAAGDLGGDVLTNYNRFLKSLPSGAGDTTIIRLPNGSYQFSADVPATNIPGSFATYTKIVGPDGVTVSFYKTTVASDGSVVSVKVKYP